MKKHRQTLLWLTILLSLVCLSPAAEVLPNGILLPDVWPPEVAPGQPMPIPYLDLPPDVIPIDTGRQLFIDDFLIYSTSMERSYNTPEISVRPKLKNPRGLIYGTWHDPQTSQFRMWFVEDGKLFHTASTDGTKWDEPVAGIEVGNGSGKVWHDQARQDSAQRWILCVARDGKGMTVYYSADGLNWGQPAFATGPCAPGSSIFYNPWRQKWVYSLKGSADAGTGFYYQEAGDLAAGAKWEKNLDREQDSCLDPGPKWWCRTPQFSAIPYESILLATAGYSRDGFHFVPAAPALAEVISSGCLVLGDKLIFYRSQEPTLYQLRRDGFASMDAGREEQVLTTRKLKFDKGKYLFVNVDCPMGHLIVEVLDARENVLDAWSQGSCMGAAVDSTAHKMVWVGKGRTLESLQGQPVRFRFRLRNGHLYSFWVSPDESGASHGYVAAGGPGFTGPTDTVGVAAKD